MPKAYENTPLNVFPDHRGGLANGQATVTGAATLRAASDNRRSITIRNEGTGVLYVGGPGVAVADGYPLEENEALTLARSTDPVYVHATGSCDVRWIEENRPL
jgi:hypothetical protein